MFDQKRHLEYCHQLPARDPESFWNPERKRVPPSIAEISLVSKHQDEVRELALSGVPNRLAKAIVFNKYKGSWQSAKTTVKAQKQELGR